VKSGRRAASRTGSLLRLRGILRVAASYAVIARLVLQIVDVVLDPCGLPAWVQRANACAPGRW
jgi:hypothetical protein